MEQSKLPKDVLELGKHLVRELSFEGGTDTLGRWMAYHLAELIDKAESSSTEAERLSACKSATETILKIWDHRTSLLGRAYPLTPYEDILKVMKLLSSNDYSFLYFGYSVDAERDRLAASLFDGLSRLIIALLLMKIPESDSSREVDPAAIKALSEAELRVWITLQQWSELFMATDKSAGKTRKNKKGSDSAQVNLDEAATRLIDSITATLVELRGNLQKADR